MEGCAAGSGGGQPESLRLSLVFLGVITLSPLHSNHAHPIFFPLLYEPPEDLI